MGPLLLLLLAKSVSLPLPPSTLLVSLLLLSLLLVGFMLELDVMLPTLLEQSMLPRGKLKLMPTILEDMVPVLDMLVLVMPVLDMLVLAMPVLDTPTPMLLPLLLLLLAKSVYLPPPLSTFWSCSCCSPCYWWTLC